MPIVRPSTAVKTGNIPITRNNSEIGYSSRGVYVVLNTSTCAYSTDGVGWSTTPMPATDSWLHLTSLDNGSLLYGSNSTTTNLAYSTDGTSWTLATKPVSLAVRGQAQNTPYWLISAGDNSYKSTDLVTWTTGTFPVTGGGWIVSAYGNGTWLAYRNLDPTASTNAAVSTDGVTWTQSTLPSSAVWSRFAYGDGYFLGIAASTTAAGVSTDGISWTARTLSNVTAYRYVYQVTWVAGYWLASFGNKNVMCFSTDAVSWTNVSNSQTGYWGGAYGRAGFVAVPENTTVLNRWTLDPYPAPSVIGNAARSRASSW